MTIDHYSIVRKVLGEFYVPRKTYHSALPLELSTWYAYASDFGHSIVCVLSQDYRPTGDLTGKLLPAPVKAVLRGYRTERGYVVVDLPYSDAYGLITDPSDNER